VPALAPEERRAAIVAATVPLLRQYGSAVSTRQIADAAGVAEGTIFGVFPDKASLIRAAVLAAFEPEPLLRAFAAIDPEHSLRVRLADAVRIVSQRLTENELLLVAARTAAAHDERSPELFAELAQSRRRLVDAIAAVIEPDAEMLRQSPQTAAGFLLSMIAANAHRAFGAVESLAHEDLVSLLLDGLLKRPGRGLRC
jgi:AcrR family transcriptional regulator